MKNILQFRGLRYKSSLFVGLLSLLASLMLGGCGTTYITSRVAEPDEITQKCSADIGYMKDLHGAVAVVMLPTPENGQYCFSSYSLYFYGHDYTAPPPVYRTEQEAVAAARVSCRKQVRQMAIGDPGVCETAGAWSRSTSPEREAQLMAEVEHEQQKHIQIGSSAAQQAKRIQNNPPSYENTMNFIAKKIDEEGDVRFTQNISVESEDCRNGTVPYGICHSTTKLASHMDSKTVNVDACYITNSFLKNVASVSVGSLSQEADEFKAKNHSDANSTFEPDYYVVSTKMSRKNMVPLRLYFKDQDTAVSVAKAVNHAVELCGGGNDSPF